MAIAKSHYKQPHLENLELPDSGFDASGYPLPSHSEIDMDTVEFVLDVDLDEFTVFFADSSGPHYIDDTNDKYAIVVDAETDRVIGVVIHQFLSEAVKLHPDLIPALRNATIIAGTSVQQPERTFGNAGPDHAGVRARIEEWVSSRVRREEQREAFASFAHLIGIH